MNGVRQVAELVGRLGRVSVFAGLNEGAVGFLAGRVQELKLAAGTRVVREGEPGNQFYAIDTGTVRVCKNCGQANELELARLGQGETFGEMSIVEPAARSASVEAVTEVVLFRLSSLDFLKLYESMPAQYGVLLLNIARELSRRLRRLDAVFAAQH
jgi:CRP/FNR family transcriptional regulator, cyclic AMP receptor protein